MINRLYLADLKNLNRLKDKKFINVINSELNAWVFNDHFLDTKIQSGINLFEEIVKKVSNIMKTEKDLTPTHELTANFNIENPIN